MGNHPEAIVVLLLFVTTAILALPTLLPLTWLSRLLRQFSLRTALVGITVSGVAFALLRGHGKLDFIVGSAIVPVLVMLLMSVGAIAAEVIAACSLKETALQRFRDRRQVIAAGDGKSADTSPLATRRKQKRRKWWQIRWPNRYHGYGPGRNQRDPVELGQRW